MEKTKELKQQLAKGRYEKLIEKEMASAELYEKLPALIRKTPSRSLNNSNLDAETLDHSSLQGNTSSKDSVRPYQKSTSASRGKYFSFESEHPRGRHLRGENHNLSTNGDSSLLLNQSDIGTESHQSRPRLAPMKHKYATIHHNHHDESSLLGRLPGIRQDGEHDQCIYISHDYCF